ncbi:MAG: hypothetical protein C0425_04040 [Chlorobiaceae bacterium]|nr:hypothetical protein [Chlorobiaceae bacterium]MBA4309487.1 hypothetical protein [Chlorobiaceae bacterium]
MIERLKTLYQLQLIDDQLDQLEELRGDLPVNVKILEEKIDHLEKTISEKKKEQKESLEKVKTNEKEIERFKENQKKFKSQLFQVRNNKEYDALTKEIDHIDDTIKKLTMEEDSVEESSKKLSADIEELVPILDDLKEELKERQSELKQIIKANEKEELKLREERSKIESKVKKTDVSIYLRIRKAKRGKGVASIKRGACSGCSNVVPAQRQLEIRRNNKMFTCEYCGRILISAEIAEDVEKN